MTNGREGSSDSSGGSDGKRRRPQSPVLDLKATSVSEGPPETPPQEGAGASSAVAENAQASSSREPDAPPPPTADPVPGEVLEDAERLPGDPPDDSNGDAVRESEPAKQERPRSAGLAWIVLAAGAGAGAGALALLLVAWLLGIPFGDDSRMAQSDERIAALEARVQDLAARPPPGPDTRIAPLADRVATLEQAVGQIAALEKRLTAIEGTVGKGEVSGAPATDAASQAQVAALEQTTKSLSAEIQALRSRLEQMRTQEPAASDRIAGEIAAVNQRVAALETAVKEVQAALARPPAPDQDRAARLAAATLGLRSAVEAGSGFSTELAAVRAIATNDPRLAALEPFATEGLPSLAALAADLRERIAKAAPPPPAAPSADASWTERLQATLARLVRVRPADEAAPRGSAYAAVQTELGRGDLAGALKAAAALPEQLRAPIEPWIERAQRRAAALAAARELSRDSLARLAAPNKEPGSK